MLQARKIFLFVQPIQLLLALLSYWLGLGLARYLGATLNIAPQFLGGTFVILFLSISNLLTVYFRPFNEPIINGETRKERETLRSLLLYCSLGFLVIAGMLIFFLGQSGYLNLEVNIIIILFVTLSLANAIPPLRLSNRGLSEISNSILLSSLAPTLAFLLQFGEFHRLLTLFTFPLVMLALTYFLALNFPSYGEDQKYERTSLLIGLSWQRAVPIHNAVLALAYLFFAAIPFFGVPFDLSWPALLTLPFAAYQAFSLRKIADGGKPFWAIFVSTATAILGLSIYLIALTFWMR